MKKRNFRERKQELIEAYNEELKKRGLLDNEETTEEVKPVEEVKEETEPVKEVEPTEEVKEETPVEVVEPVNNEPVEEVKEETTEEVVEEVKDEPVEEEDLSKYTKAELIEMLAQKGIEASDRLTKAELIEMLNAPVDEPVIEEEKPEEIIEPTEEVIEEEKVEE